MTHPMVMWSFILTIAVFAIDFWSLLQLKRTLKNQLEMTGE